MIRTSKFLGGHFWCQCCYIFSFLMVCSDMLLCLFCILFNFFSNNKKYDRLEFLIQLSMQTDKELVTPLPIRLLLLSLTSRQSIQSKDSPTDFRIFTTPYDTLLHSHQASSYILAIRSLYNSKWLSGESIRCWFRFVTRLSRPRSHKPYDTFYNHTIYLSAPPVGRDHAIYWSAEIYTIISKNLTPTGDSIQYINHIY